jgi:hypothetical protein
MCSFCGVLNWHSVVNYWHSVVDVVVAENIASGGCGGCGGCF